MNFEKIVAGTMLLGLSACFLVACDQSSKRMPSTTERVAMPNAEAAINRSEANCLSPVAAKTIQDLIVEGVEVRAREENKGMSEDRRLDLSKVRAIASQARVDLQDVLTSKSDPNSTKRFCEATLVIAIGNDEIMKADELRRRSSLNSIKSVAEDAGFRVDVNKFTKRASYSVQPTDDGSKIFVSLEGGTAYINLMGETALWAVANTVSGLVKANAVTTAIREQPPAVLVNPSSTQDQPLQDELARSVQRFNAFERDINVVWRALPKDIRDANLSEQRQFNKEKENFCFSQASDAGSGARFEIAKNNCWADMYDKRLKQLKTLN